MATYTSGDSGAPPTREEEAILDLSLERRTHGTWAVVDVGGELDLYTAPSFQGTAAGPRIAVWRRLRADDRTREPSRCGPKVEAVNRRTH